MTIAYWISPKGEIVPVSDSHIATVINSPETFGLTLDEIKSKFDEYGEKLGQEGIAREQIILDLIKKGWIRIRKYGNRGWNVNIPRLTKRIKDYLFDWSVKLTSPEGLFGIKEKDMYSDVHVLSFIDDISKTYSFKDIMNSVMYEKNESFDNSNILIECELNNNNMKKWIDILRGK